MIAEFSCFSDGILVGILKEFRQHLQNSDSSEVEKHRMLSFRGPISYLFGVCIRTSLVGIIQEFQLEFYWKTVEFINVSTCNSSNKYYSSMH
jgi:hypothetical protein